MAKQGSVKMNLNEVTVCILTKNSEGTLKRAIDSVKNRVGDILIIDSYSTDRTLEIANPYRVIQMKGDFSELRNAGISACKTKYVMMMDSDEWVDRKFLEELKSAPPNEPVAVRRTWHYMGKELRFGRHSLQVRVFPVHSAHYKGQVHEELYINGIIAQKNRLTILTNGKLHHEPWGSEADIIAKRERYMRLEPRDAFSKRFKGILRRTKVYLFQGIPDGWIGFKLWSYDVSYQIYLIVRDLLPRTSS